MPVLKQGSTGPEVKDLQQKLKDLGFDPKGVDGSFGPGTRAAVITFQKSKGLQADGIAGPATQAALGAGGGSASGGSAGGGSAPSDAGTGTATVPAATVGGGLSLEMLQKIMPHCKVGNQVLPTLNETMNEFKINNRLRAAAFLATLAVESGEYKYVEEIASGAAYEGRRDLGNTQPGDGRRFKGHGRIQLTGRDVHKACGDYFGVDLIANPKLAAEEPLATKSAGWFWVHYKTQMNELADQGDFLRTQIKVNGRNKKTGLPNGWPERQEYYKRALAVLPASFGFDQ
jgi:predicted chitinase